jgi:ribosomal protein S12 methylthiotransferase accessory factor
MMSEAMNVSFPGGKRVDVSVGPFVVQTDQPHELGGEGAAPAPFDLFLASLATCAGVYVLGFCQARGLDVTGIQLSQRVETDPESHLPRSITLDLYLPPHIPEKYRAAIVRAAEGCKVKKSILAQPTLAVVLREHPLS